MDYARIEKAIMFLKENFQKQPTLEEVAQQIHLSPFHFQRMFKDWAGVSPKKFVQFLSVEYAKELLNRDRTLADVSFETGLSGTSRLHDLFVSIEGMTPGEYKNKGEGLTIKYSFGHSPFGKVIIASTSIGICHLAFFEEEQKAIAHMKAHFPKALFLNERDELQEDALKFFHHDWNDLKKIKLHLKGTPFQLNVWKSLLQIPLGNLSTYGEIAQAIEHPGASRAVGTAIGSNPIAFIIPCHRVIRSTGIIGEYLWGSYRKTAMLGWEAAKCFPEEG